MIAFSPSFPRRGLAAAAVLAAFAAPAAAQAPTAGPTVKSSVSGVYEIVVSEQTGDVYVAATGGRAAGAARVLVLDGQTLQKKGEIDVSEASAFGLGLNDRTQTLYTTGTRAGAVGVIDLRSGRMVKTIESADTSAHVREAVVDEGRNRVYVSVVGTPGKIWVIDGATNTLSRVIEGVGAGTTGIALDAQANKLYATNMQGGDVAVVDVESGRVERTFSAGGERPTNVAFDAATQRLFVANQGSGNVTVLDARTGRLIQAIPTGEGALGVSFHAGTGRVYVANRGAGTVTVIDAASLNVLGQLQTGSHPNTVAIHRGNGTAYVTNKARSAGRGQPPVDDPNGDTVTRIRP